MTRAGLQGSDPAEGLLQAWNAWALNGLAAGGDLCLQDFLCLAQDFLSMVRPFRVPASPAAWTAATSPRPQDGFRPDCGGKAWPFASRTACQPYPSDAMRDVPRLARLAS